MSRIDWCRSLTMFVMAWLIGLYVYEVAAGRYGEGVGIGLAVITLVVNGFARWRALKNIRQANFAFYLWMAVPLILFFGVPCLVKLMMYMQDRQRQPWYHYLASLLPFILKLGVPVATLFWIYIVLGGMRRRLMVEAESGETR